VANTKQKQAPEGANRRPGKSRFSIPQKETPPIDGSYLERLFADFEKQSQEMGGQDSGAAATAESSLPAAEIRKEATPEPVVSPAPETVQEAPPPTPSLASHPQPVAEARPAATAETSAVSPPAPPPRRKGTVAHVGDTPAPRAPEIAVDDTVLLEKLKKKHRLGKGEIKILRAMIGFCRESGTDYCYIKIPQLMAASGLKERQTQVVLRSLRELELIEKLADYSNIDRLGTKYKVNFSSF
jgi:hypothetical protein